MTVIQIGFIPTALKTAVLVPLLVSVPVASWMAVQQSRIKQLNQRLQEMVRRDPLTGLLNSPEFVKEVEQVLQGGGLLIVCDVDRFKEVNDTFGHAAGDDVLIGIANDLRTQADANWLLGRLGGDEFGLFVPGISLNHGLVLAESLQRKLGRSGIQNSGLSIECTLSLGLCMVTPANPLQSVRTTEALAAADAALYAAKLQGRNKFVFYNLEREPKLGSAPFMKFDSGEVEPIANSGGTVTSS